MNSDSTPVPPADARPIFVPAANGKTASRVVARLQAGGVAVRTAGRRSAVRFDWNEPATWDAALEGCGAAYLTFQPDLALPGADAIVGAVAARAAAHGIADVVLLSGRGELGAQRSEAALFAELPMATVLRASWFDQNFSEGVLAPAVLGGTIALPAPATMTEPFVDIDDLADAAVAVLTGAVGEQAGGRAFEVTGPESLSFEQVASELASATGRHVAYVEVSAEQFAAGAVADGMDPDEAEALAELFSEILDGRNEGTADGVAELLGRPARSFATFAAGAAAAGVWS